jgi:hypothetical protein
MGYIGVFAGVLIVLPVPPFQLLTALWLAAVGFLLMGRWPGGDPPAWEQGVAIPWPSAAEKRAMADGVEYVPPTGGSRGLFGPRRPRGAAAEPVAAVGDTTPEPMAPPHPRSNKRKSRRRDR